ALRRKSNVRRLGPMKALGVIFAAALLVVFADAVAAQKPVVSEIKEIEVTARPIAGFDRQNIDRQRFGRLQWRGGLVLSSTAPEFGGWSGLVLDKNGSRVLAISDAGAWLMADVGYDGSRPARVVNA